MNMHRDFGNQTYFWNLLGGLIAWLSDQQNLMILSLVLGMITTLVNMYSKCQEGQIRRRDEQRKEELHELQVKKLKKDVDDE